MAKKRISRTNKAEVNFQEQFTGIAKTLQDIASSFNSRSREQNDGKGELKETNGILRAIKGRLPKTNGFTKLKTSINNNTRSLDKLSKSINQLMSALGKTDLGSDDKSTTNITKNIDLDSTKNKNIDINPTKNKNIKIDPVKNKNLKIDSTKNKNIKINPTPQSKAKGDYDNYLEKRRIERAKKDLPRAKFNYNVTIYQELIKTLNPLKEMNKELGLSYKTLIGMNVEAMKLYTTSQFFDLLKYGVGLKSIIKVQTAVGEISGTLNTLSEKQISDVAILSSKYQVDEKTMTEMSVLFSSMSTDSKDTNKDLIDQVGILADINKVAPAQAFKDLSSASENIALMGMKNVKNLAQSVILSKKWGMNIDKTYSTMEKMVFSFESSVEQLIELQALTGKEVDINKMFLASVSGDSETMTREIRSRLEDAQGNMVATKVVMEAFGLSAKNVATILGKTTEELEKNADGTAKATDKQKSVIDNILRVASGVSEVSTGILSGLSVLSGIKYQRANLKEMKELSEKVSNFSGKFSASGKQINSTTETLAGATKNMGKSSGFSGLLKKAFNPATILSVGVLAISLAYSFKIMSESISNFADVGWQQALTALGMFSALVLGTNKLLITSGKITTVAIKPMLVAIGVMSALAGSLWLMGEGVNLASTGLAELFKVASFSNFAGFIGTMTTLSALSPSLAISSTALAGGLWLLTKSLKPLVDLGKDSNEINKIPASLKELSNLDLSFAKIELNPLNDLIKKLKEVKDALSSINNEKVSFDIKRNVETISGGNNNVNNNMSNSQLISKLSELISAVKNKSEIGLDSTTMRKLESIFEG